MVTPLQFLATLFVLVWSPVLCGATGVERVVVTKAMDDQAIITRSNGESFLIEKGIGCLSLWRYEGKEVLINSPGFFLGVGSSLLIPELDQQCRIWNSKFLGAGSAPTRSRSTPTPRAPSTRQEASLIQSIQRALALLGYDPGPSDGVVGAKTLTAFARYRDSKGLPATEQGLALALASLPGDLIAKQPSNPEAFRVANTLSSALMHGTSTGQASSPTDRCSEGHWINSVTADGGVVVLEDGSVWQVNTLDTIRTMLWLPVSRVMICGDSMINNSNGQTARVTRLR